MGTPPKATRALIFFTTMKFITMITIALATTLGVQAKTWRNMEGKSIEGEYVSRTDKDVTIRLGYM